MNEGKKLKYLQAARSVFLRYGYKRTTMNDIAEAVGVSRAALYLVFKNKEEIFVSVLERWVDEIITEVRKAVAPNLTAKEKLELAFAIWAVRPFEIMCSSPESKELLECNLDFAQASLRAAYSKFEATIAPFIAALAPRRSPGGCLAPARTAHILVSAVHGLKHTAKTSIELRQLIEDLLVLALPSLIVETKRRA
jgi:AcrR family transcriptional regulator